MNDSSPVMFATAWRICEGGICKRRQMICIDIEKGPLRYINVPGDQGKMPISCRPSREWQPPRLVPSVAARRQRNPATSTACSVACLQSACSCRHNRCFAIAVSPSPHIMFCGRARAHNALPKLLNHHPQGHSRESNQLRIESGDEWRAERLQRPQRGRNSRCR